MSNRPPDDDFGFDDDFDFDDDLDSGTANEDFDFGEEDAFSFEDDEFNFGDDEEIVFEEQEERQGPSRTFIIIAAAMIGLFVIALVVLLLFALPSGPTEIELTSTAIAIQNATTIALGNETATQAVIIAQVQTEDANLTATALAQPTDTPTPTPTDTPTLPPTPDETEGAAIAFMTQTQAAIDLAATSAAETAAAEEQAPVGPPTIEINAVAQTATALAMILQPTVNGQGGGVVATPTIEGALPGPGPLPTALPDTGLFDDLAAGNPAGVGGLMLAVFGLLGVIVISRRLRAANR